ncbi:MAG: DUF4364 family protein [Treponema sp.]|nr:DUF4364 family protein [Treponema sp.]
MELKEHDVYVLYAAEKLSGATPAQLTRFLFESGIFQGFDLSWSLANLNEAGHLVQAISSNGICYEITDQGKNALAQGLSEADQGKLKELDEKGAEFSRIFRIEEDYPAQYTESANAIVPVFLSIREGAKILMKVSIIVEDTETARDITKNWAQNARDTYKAIWESIGQGRPFPSFTPY